MNTLETMQRVGVIHLENGGFTVVDPEQLEELNRFTWRLSPFGYVTRTKKGEARHVRLHRQVMGARSTDPDVDHRHCDKLDNRRDSLRFATQSQNGANSRKLIFKTSTYKGVSWNKRRGKWEAWIKVAYKAKLLGRFGSELEAAKAYDSAALERFGEFARINAIL